MTSDETGVGGVDPLDARSLARRLFDAALAGAHPGRAVSLAVERLDLPPSRRVRLLAVGKASPAMASAAAEALVRRGARVTGGLAVAPADTDAGLVLPVALELAEGAHPVPDERSSRAAERLGAHAAAVARDELALVLLSGGTSSLVAAPLAGDARAVPASDLARLTSALLAAGTDIAVTNAVRRRFARWGAGRLAAALRHAWRVHLLVVSDVPGDDPALVGSGPCSPDPLTASDVMRLLALHEVTAPRAIVEHLERVARGELPETPKPGDAAFERVTVEVVLDNRAALNAAARAARSLGIDDLEIDGEALAGEARTCGERLASTLLGLAGESRTRGSRRALVRLWGGETTVTLGRASGLGGRSQELALAAARTLRNAGVGVALLAGGTDGRDGPTDAAGALVDARTWDAIAAAGRDPARDLDAHDAYGALDAAGALVRTGATGTNVMDVAVGVVVRSA